MPRRWTPTLAAATALVIVAATGGMLPSAAVRDGAAERTTDVLTPSTTDDVGPHSAASDVTAADAPAAEDAVDPTGSHGALAQAVTERSTPGLNSSASGRAMLEQYAGDVPSYVHAGPLSLADVHLSFDHPVAGPFTISSSFGWRKNPTDVGPTVQFHIGQDYAIACGTPVRAAADGLVTSAGERDNGDRRVDIDHGSGLATSYRHNSRLLVSPGDRVSRGDLISLSGTTGNSTGCHLHFDASIGGKYVDPVLLLPAVAGQPRPLDAEELHKLRAAADQSAGDVSRAPSDDTGHEHLQASTAGPSAQRAEPSAEPAAAAARDRPASTPTKSSPVAPVASAPATKPTQSASAVPESPASAKPATQTSSPATPGPTTPTVTPSTPESTSPEPAPEPSSPRAEPEPTSPAPTPTEPAPTDPSPSAPPTASEPAPTQGEQSQPAPTTTTPTPAQPVAESTSPVPTPTPTPTPPDPTSPDPTSPDPTTTQPEPNTPEATATSPTPTPPEPNTPEATATSPTPTPTQPAPTDPSESEPPPAPETLTDSEAAQWCLPLDHEDGADEESRAGADADRPQPDFTDVPVSELVELIATLDEDGEPQPVTEELLDEVSPSDLWLESLPVCSDAEFREAALEARATD